MDEIIKQDVPTAAPAETEQEYRRRIDRERKRAQRAEQRAKESAEQSDEARQGIIQAQWKRNLSKLNQKQTRELDDRVEDFTYIEDLCYWGSSRMNANEAVGQDDGYGFVMEPEIWAKEVSQFAAEFPPVEEPTFDYLNLKEMGYYFQQYGLHLDGIDAQALSNFRHYFKVWTEAQSKPPAAVPKPTPPQVPEELTPEQRAEITLRDIRGSGTDVFSI